MKTSLIIIFLMLISTISYCQQVSVYSSGEDLKAFVRSIMPEAEAAVCRRIHCENYGYNFHQIHQVPLCVDFSEELSKIFTQHGIYNEIFGNSRHKAVITFINDKNGWNMWIVDPTYRQFFVKDAENYVAEKDLPELFDAAGMPEVLVEEYNRLQDVYSAFRFKPDFNIRQDHPDYKEGHDEI